MMETLLQVVEFVFVMVVLVKQSIELRKFDERLKDIECCLWADVDRN